MYLKMLYLSALNVLYHISNTSHLVTLWLGMWIVYWSSDSYHMYFLLEQHSKDFCLLHSHETCSEFEYHSLPYRCNQKVDGFFLSGHWSKPINTNPVIALEQYIPDFL